MMSQKTDFLLLSSPPASGKTYWIKEFLDSLEEEILMISPLRALADECRAKWLHGIRIETPESWLAEQKTFRIVIFDEFHLLFYWGDTFRSKMWECFYELSSNCEIMIGLTATASLDLQHFLPHMRTCFDRIYWCDLGNQQFKYPPSRYVHLPSRIMMKHFILNQKPLPGGVILVFCGYRQEVFKVASELRQRGFEVWTCVGGEARDFSIKVRTEQAPHFIVSTTVLSHGVNLPKIVRILFLDPVNCLDFWIQMVARGGRRGESYEVFSLEKPIGIKFNSFINFLAILQLSFRMKLHQYFEQFIQWFLKAS